MVKLTEVLKVACWEVDCWSVQQREGVERVGCFVFGGRHYDEMVVTVGRLGFGENFEVHF